MRMAQGWQRNFSNAIQQAQQLCEPCMQTIHHVCLMCRDFPRYTRQRVAQHDEQPMHQAVAACSHHVILCLVQLRLYSGFDTPFPFRCCSEKN